MKYIALSILFTSLLLTVSCRRKYVRKQVTVLWTGPVSTTGCGFFVAYDNKRYKVKNEEILGEEFMVDSSQALMDFKTLYTTRQHACLGRVFNENFIKILSVEKL